jgi:hypothetical protein
MRQLKIKHIYDIHFQNSQKKIGKRVGKRSKGA